MEYSVEYSFRKSISISVKGDAVRIKAPLGAGKADIERAINKHRAWIEKRLIAEKEKATVHLSTGEVRNLKRDARLYFLPEVEKYSKIMGIKYSSVKITSAKTRFGSCSSRGNICFSFLLMLYPVEAREYVVVHELAHRKEMNHSHRFYEIVEGVLPDFKSRRELLKAPLNIDFD